MDIVTTQAEKILALTSAAKVEVEPIWASLLAKVSLPTQESSAAQGPVLILWSLLCTRHPQALEGKDVKDLLTNVGSGGAAPAAAAATGGAAPAAAAEEKKEEKVEEKEESDDDMGFGLFD